MKLNILGKQDTIQESNMEEIYYRKILGKNLRFIKNFSGRETYKIIKKFKYVLNIDSTLGLENFSSGGRTGFIFNRPYITMLKKLIEYLILWLTQMIRNGATFINLIKVRLCLKTKTTKHSSQF